MVALPPFVQLGSGAAGRSATRARDRGLSRPDEGAHEQTIDLRDDAVFEASLIEEVLRIRGPVDSCGLDLDVLEARTAQLLTVAALRERSSNTPDPELHASTDFHRHVVVPDDHIRHGKPP